MQNSFKLYTTKEIKPRGWLLRQLKLQAEGLNGNLDKVWPDVRDSMWIGGDREGWERVPYWLDGFITLAGLLDDEDMKGRAKRYIDKILEFQRPDGWICPNGDTPLEKYDNWAVQLIGKVLTVYYESTGDERIPDVLYRIMKNYYELLSSGKIKLFNWACYRWYETFVALNMLKRLYPEETWIDELASILREQGADYESFSDKWVTPMYNWDFETHIVNLVMALKAEAVSCSLLGEEYTDLAERLYRKLKKYNGTAVETFTGDECLSGISPIQGTELCSVVELMYSYELLYAYSGDKKWAERLERVAFNALPATISEDMWTHQYVQMVNQIDCTNISGHPPFRTNCGEAHVFGLEPHFGCCTANFGQGWPKLTLSSFMRSEDGILCAMPIPAEVRDTYKGASVKVTLDTDYPFKNSFIYRVESDKRTSMKLRIRIPSFARELTVNGKPMTKRSMLVFSGFSSGVTEIRIAFSATPRIVARPNGMQAVEYGPLVFSLPIESKWARKEYRKDGVERKFPYCDYRIKGTTPWQFALDGISLKVAEAEVGDIPFSEKASPLTLTARLYPIDWGYETGYTTVARKAPRSRVPTGDAVEMKLIPYGCTTLRMTELPRVKKK